MSCVFCYYFALQSLFNEWLLFFFISFMHSYSALHWLIVSSAGRHRLLLLQLCTFYAMLWTISIGYFFSVYFNRLSHSSEYNWIFFSFHFAHQQRLPFVGFFVISSVKSYVKIKFFVLFVRSTNINPVILKIYFTFIENRN